MRPGAVCVVTRLGCTPPLVNKQAVRILLECFLVSLFIQKLRLTCIVGVVYVKLQYRASYIELENKLYTSLLCQTSLISWKRQRIFLKFSSSPHGKKMTAVYTLQTSNPKFKLLRIKLVFSYSM